jgi:hypothetical protein
VLLLCVLFAAPLVEGRVGEPAGMGVQGARVTLSQGPGERTQLRRTAADGSFRFRALEGPASISVELPKGWTLEGAAVVRLKPLVERIERIEFIAHPRRLLRGKLLLKWRDETAPVAGVSIGRTETDAQGSFTIDGLPAGRVELKADLLSETSIEMPAGPAEMTRDVVVDAPVLKEAIVEVAGVRLRVVPQPAAERAIADWAEGKPMNDSEIGAIERLAALANLDARFRLLLLAAPAPGELGRALQAAVTLERYLAGPALVPRERLLFAVGNVARKGLLALILARVEAPGEQ